MSGADGKEYFLLISLPSLLLLKGCGRAAERLKEIKRIYETRQDPLGGEESLLSVHAGDGPVAAGRKSRVALSFPDGLNGDFLLWQADLSAPAVFWIEFRYFLKSYSLKPGDFQIIAQDADGTKVEVYGNKEIGTLAVSDLSRCRCAAFSPGRARIFLRGTRLDKLHFRILIEQSDRVGIERRIREREIAYQRYEDRMRLLARETALLEEETLSLEEDTQELERLVCSCDAVPAEFYLYLRKRQEKLYRRKCQIRKRLQKLREDVDWMWRNKPN